MNTPHTRPSSVGASASALALQSTLQRMRVVVASVQGCAVPVFRAS